MRRRCDQAVAFENLPGSFRRRTQLGKIGKISRELNFFVSDLGYPRERAFKVFAERVPNRVKLKPDPLDSMLGGRPGKAAHDGCPADTGNKTSAIHAVSTNLVV